MGLERGYNSPRRKCGRVVDCTGLENRRLERVREFESHRFRQITIKLAPFGAFFIFHPAFHPYTYQLNLTATLTGIATIESY
jgi:hypothetical protein